MRRVGEIYSRGARENMNKMADFKDCHVATTIYLQDRDIHKAKIVAAVCKQEQGAKHGEQCELIYRHN